MPFWKNKPDNIPPVVELPIEQIEPSPHQTRQRFPEGELLALAQSIDRNGLLNPISVRQAEGGGWCLIAGERRLMACRRLGWVRIPAIVWERDAAGAAALTLAENLHRSGLHYLEEAAGILRLLTEGDMTQAAAASLLAMSQSALCNKLRLLRLSPAVQEQLLQRDLPERVARALLTLPDEDLQLRAIRHVAAQGMNVRQTEEYINRLLHRQGQKRPYHGLLRDYRILFTTVDRAVEEIRKCGVAVSTQRREEEDCISYTIRIPKTGTSPAAPTPEDQMSLYA